MEIKLTNEEISLIIAALEYGQNKGLYNETLGKALHEKLVRKIDKLYIHIVGSYVQADYIMKRRFCDKDRYSIRRASNTVYDKHNHITHKFLSIKGNMFDGLRPEKTIIETETFNGEILTDLNKAIAIKNSLDAYKKPVEKLIEKPEDNLGKINSDFLSLRNDEPKIIINGLPAEKYFENMIKDIFNSGDANEK